MGKYEDDIPLRMLVRQQTEEQRRCNEMLADHIQKSTEWRIEIAKEVVTLSVNIAGVQKKTADHEQEIKNMAKTRAWVRGAAWVLAGLGLTNVATILVNHYANK